MKRAAFFTLTFFFLSSIFAACCMSTSCGCGGGEGSSYKVTGFDLSLLEYSESANDPNPFDNPALPTNAAVAHDQFIFAFDPDIAPIAFNKSILHSAANFAYACDPSYLPSQEYVSIKITSTSNYQTASGNFAAGEDLFSLFTMHGASTRETLSQSDPAAYDNSFFLTLKTPPVSASTHRFTFTFELSDGSEIVITSASIELF